MQSTGRSRPSAVTTPAGVMRSTSSVDQLHVGALERGQVVRAEQDPLAARRGSRASLRAALRVLQLAAHEELRPGAQQRAQRLHAGDAGHERLHEQPHPVAAGRLEPGHVRDRPAHEVRVGVVVARQHVRARCAGTRRGARPARPPRARTGSRSPGADHRHALPRHVVVVVPLGRVEGVPAELVHPGQRRPARAGSAGRRPPPGRRPRSPRPWRCGASSARCGRRTRRPPPRCGCARGRSRRACARCRGGSRGSPAGDEQGWDQSRRWS